MVGLKKISPKPLGDIFSIEKGGHERESPVPGDHFDFPCCGGVWNEPWHCILPYSLGTSDMGVSAGPTQCWSSHVTRWKIWLWTWHGHKEHALPMDLLLSESTGLLCLLHLLFPVFCSLLRVPWPAGRCPCESTIVNVCWLAQGGVWCRTPPQISSWSVGSMQNSNMSPRNKGNDFWSSLALRETWMINFNRYRSPQQQQHSSRKKNWIYIIF